MTDDKPFREKIAAVMVGHSMAEITDGFVVALGHVLREADPEIRERVVGEACARVRHPRRGKDGKIPYFRG